MPVATQPSTSALTPTLPWNTAFHYAETRGWHVVPYYALGPNGLCNCSKWHKTQGRCHPAKHPRPRPGYKAATNSLSAIAKWSRRWPQSNIAVATGPSRLVGFDPDSRHGGNTLLAELIAELGPLPETWTFQSGSGDIRYLFRLPEGVNLPTGKIVRGERKLDIIGDPGTMLIAGVHHSGRPYVDLTTATGGAELPRHWAEFILRELPLATGHNVLRTICAPGERGKDFISKDEADADSLSLACFYRLCQRRGLEIPTLGQPVLCWLHPTDQHPSSGFYVNPKDGRVRFHCFHDNKSWALAEVYARTFCGVGPSVALSKAQLAVFDTRMQIDLELIERPEVPHIPLPSDAPQLDHCLYAGFLDAVACKSVRHPGEPITFSRGFARVWCPVPIEVSDRALDASWHRLCDQGFVLQIDIINLGGKDAKQYLPCPLIPSVGGSEAQPKELVTVGANA
jgi:hypothetical protein